MLSSAQWGVNSMRLRGVTTRGNSIVVPPANQIITTTRTFGGGFGPPWRERGLERRLSPSSSSSSSMTATGSPLHHQHHSFFSCIGDGRQRQGQGRAAFSSRKQAAAAAAETTPTTRFDVLKVLRERGLLNDATNEQGLSIELKQGAAPSAVYCGFDPTADSLHLGNLLGIIVLTWFGKAGHKVIALCGGATGLVGDPSGKSAERPMLDVETLQHNTTCIGNQLKNLMSFAEEEAEEDGRDSMPSEIEVEIVNNLEWFENMTFLDFLRDVGKFARVGTMLNKDSVKSRMETSDEEQGTGLSFTEFSYQLLQGYDFMHLYKSRECKIQIGGSDQWGNITAGTDLIKRLCGQTPPPPSSSSVSAEQEGEESQDLSLAYGITFPLLVGSDGKKFGKSEGGAIWLDGKKLSPYHMYQHLLRTPDSDVGKFLKMLTFLDMSEIEDIVARMDPSHPNHSGPNAAQKVLAAEVTRFVHGKKGLEEALKITKGLFESQKKTDGPPSLEAFEALVLSGNAPKAQLVDSEVIGNPVVDVLVKVGLQPSKSAVRRMIKGGAIRVNNRLVKDEGEIIEKKEAVDNRFMLLAAGKKNKMIVELLN